MKSQAERFRQFTQLQQQLGLKFNALNQAITLPHWSLSLDSMQFTQLQQQLGLKFNALNQAIATSEAEFHSLQQLIVPKPNRALVEDASVVFFGSLARGESTSKSDADWILLVD